jgi:hypothetical protein
MCLLDPNRLDAASLEAENARFQGTGGVSEGNYDRGFRPAFRDTVSGRVELARFGDGRCAPFHCLEGLPADWAAEWDASGCVTALVSGIEAGFVRGEQFFTRDEAAAVTADVRAAG